MRIFAFLFSCVFLLAGCQTTSDQYGSGPLTLRASVKSGFQQYLKHLKPAHFAVSTDGRYYSYFYCETGCAAGSTSAIDAIKRCENRSNGVPCKLFARQRTIVWQGFDADKDLAMTDYNWKEHVGSGKLSFTSSQKEGFAEYLSRESREYPYGVFAVSRNGGWAYSWSKRRDRATNNAMNNCADFVAGTCKVYAVGDRVVWDGADAEAAADSSAPTITRSNPALPGRRKVTVIWQGHDSPLTGWVDLKGGRLGLTLDSGFICEGHQQMDQTTRKGNWTLTCPDNLSAGGTFTWGGPGNGTTGEGVDNRGRGLEFRVGAES